MKNNLIKIKFLKDFDSIEDIKLWMIDNQKGRRNLTDGWKFELEQSKKEILLIKGKEKMILGGGDQKSGLSIIDKPYISKHNTQKEIANKGGTTTLSTIDKVAHNTQKEIANKGGTTTLSIVDKVEHDTRREIAKELNKLGWETKRESILSNQISIDGTKKYDKKAFIYGIQFKKIDTQDREDTQVLTLPYGGGNGKQGVQGVQGVHKLNSQREINISDTISPKEMLDFYTKQGLGEETKEILEESK